jgi:hypothetical protein
MNPCRTCETGKYGGEEVCIWNPCYDCDLDDPDCAGCPVVLKGFECNERVESEEVNRVKIGKLRSDYDPKTVLQILRLDDGDVGVHIFGKGEFRIAGPSGGSHIPWEKKQKLVNLLSEVIDVLNEIGDFQYGTKED